MNSSLGTTIAIAQGDPAGGDKDNRTSVRRIVWPGGYYIRHEIASPYVSYQWRGDSEAPTETNATQMDG